MKLDEFAKIAAQVGWDASQQQGRLAGVKFMIATRAQTDADKLITTQRQLAESLGDLRRLQASTVELIFELQGRIELWHKIVMAMIKKDDDGFVQWLKDWHEDALERLYAGQGSRSTSDVSNAAYAQEHAAYASVGRQVRDALRHLNRG